MPSQNITSFVTFIGIILTFFVGILNYFHSLKKIKVENVTRYRVEWMGELRNLISQFIVLTDPYKTIINSRSIEKYGEFRDSLIRINSLIKLHLNFKGNLDKELLLSLHELLDNVIIMLHLSRLLVDSKRGSNVMEFQSYANSIPDIAFFRFLHKHALDHNPDNALEGIEETNFLEYKTKIISDYAAVRNSKCFLDSFYSQIVTIKDHLIEVNSSKRETMVRLAQIYLKAEWTRVKKEGRIWPFSLYNEKKIIAKLMQAFES